MKNMIGKTEWFARRKYSGWGLTPVRPQGFIYIAVVILIGYLLQQIPVAFNIKMIITGIFVSLVVADLLHVMAAIRMDEREAKIEAIAERNSSWAMVTALAMSMVYAGTAQLSLDFQGIIRMLIMILLAGLAVKALSNFILRNKEL